MELSRSAELSEVGEEEEVVRIVEGLAQRNERDFGRNFDLKTRSETFQSKNRWSKSRN